MEQKRAGGRPGRMKKKEKKRNGIPARTRRGILAACMVFFFSLQIFQGKMLWRESTGESPGKVLSGKVPAEENERTQIMETTQQKEPVSDAQTAQEKETREQEREQLLTRLYARSAALVDADSGRVLLGKEEHVMRPMASTTKIMTCILALEKGNPKDLVTASANAVAQPKVHLGMHEGEAFYLGDLLYSLMLESHNDAAVAIAEAVGGSVEDFADMMNRKAAELGCDDTYFLTPNGLDAEDKESGKIHSTTAADLARILRYCISLSPAKEEFLAITRAPSHAFSDLSGIRSFSCVNHNALLTSMEGAVSGKTGFTGKAGYCYVGAVKKDEKLFIAALLDCGWPPHRTYKWQDMRKLVTYGDKNFEYKEIEKTGLGEETAVLVENGVESRVKVEIGTEHADRNSLRVLLGNDEKVQVRTKIAKLLHAPVREGTPVGQRDYMVDGIVIDSDPVVTAGNVELWDFEYAEKIVMGKFWM